MPTLGILLVLSILNNADSNKTVILAAASSHTLSSIYAIDCRVRCGAVFGAPEGLCFYSCFRTSKLLLQLPNTPPTGSVSVFLLDCIFKVLGSLWLPTKVGVKFLL